jgi:hypothetical protein
VLSARIVERRRAASQPTDHRSQDGGAGLRPAPAAPWMPAKSRAGWRHHSRPIAIWCPEWRHFALRLSPFARRTALLRATKRARSGGKAAGRSSV